jgi:PIN domain nuclease of toxin-antitoxin system
VERADSPLLLDTHVWIWLLDGVRGKFSAACLSALRQGSQESRLWVSAISVWEVATLESKGRISLSLDCRAWVEAALRAPGVHLAEFSPSIALDSAGLPGSFHGDPADRILVATARQLGMTLVTKDEGILKYSGLGYVRALNAGK